ncbi:MAG: Hsp20/alpha crystallin family protein [Oscillospiraceae bacterium]|nr:Hsp20/alpha crystallin family protein [Oscillospiraceae bacterium]
MFELIPFTRHVSVYDPFRAFDEMQRNFFNEQHPVLGFRTDVSDNGEAYKLEAELPGFKKEDIHIDVEDDCLTISVERKQTKDDKNVNYVKRELILGTFRRSFDVSGIEVDKIQAAYQDGILTLTLPKKVEVKPACRKLEIQ